MRFHFFMMGCIMVERLQNEEFLTVNKLLAIEVALLVILVAATVFIRVGVLDRPTESLPPEQTQGEVLQTQPSPSEPGQSQPSHSEPAQTQPSTAAPTEPEIVLTFSEDFSLESRDYFVYDCQQDRILAEAGGLDDKLYPASITKLFTAYVALQYLQPEQVVTLGREVNMVAPDSSLAHVKMGQKISVGDLVKGMLLPSGNDAAYGLAAAAARSQSGQNLEPAEAVAHFVTLMNDTAQALGMTGSRFMNPDGYHEMEHYTSNRDMMIIGMLAMENECIRECVMLTQERVVYSNGEVSNWHNTNALIDETSQYYCPDAVGLKTGHTSYAGFCLLSAFEIEGKTYIVGTLGCQRPEDRFIDALKLYDVLVTAIRG